MKIEVFDTTLSAHDLSEAEYIVRHRIGLFDSTRHYLRDKSRPAQSSKLSILSVCRLINQEACAVMYETVLVRLPTYLCRIGPGVRYTIDDSFRSIIAPRIEKLQMSHQRVVTERIRLDMLFQDLTRLKVVHLVLDDLALTSIPLFKLLRPALLTHDCLLTEAGVSEVEAKLARDVGFQNKIRQLSPNQANSFVAQCFNANVAITIDLRIYRQCFHKGVSWIYGPGEVINYCARISLRLLTSSQKCIVTLNTGIMRYVDKNGVHCGRSHLPSLQLGHG